MKSTFALSVPKIARRLLARERIDRCELSWDGARGRAALFQPARVLSPNTSTRVSCEDIPARINCCPLNGMIHLLQPKRDLVVR